MSWDEEIKCMACPGAVFTDRDVYAAHVKTKWHLYNTNCRMMGNSTLSCEGYIEKFGDPTAVGSVLKDLGNQQEKKAQEKEAEAKKEEAKEEEAVEGEMVTVVVMFTYQEEKWSHKFPVKKGSTIWDLKQSMVKPDSPEEDVLSFSLKVGMIRAWNFETIESDETYEFQYIGPEEGQKFLDRDKARKQRDDDEARERLEEEQRKQEEKKQLEEERRRQAEESELQEKRRQEEEEKRRREEEEAERWRQEEEARRKKEEEEEAERKRLEEEARREQEAQAERQRLEEEERKRQQEKEEEEERRRQQEKEEEERRNHEEQARIEQERQAEEQRKAELAAQEPIEVTVYIDRALDFKSSLTLTRGARVREVKEHLAADDPTGQLRAEDLGLLDSSQRELGDDEQLLQTAELDLRSAAA